MNVIQILTHFEGQNQPQITQESGSGQKVSKIEQPSKTTVFTRVFEGLGLKQTLNFQHFQSKYRFENRSKFLYRFLLYCAQLGEPFGSILGSLFTTFDPLSSLRLGFGRLWVAVVVNLEVLGNIWSPWGRFGVAFWWIWLHF